MSDLEHYEVSTLRVVYADEPIDRDARTGYHDEVQAYVVYGFHSQYVFGVRR